MRLGARRVDYLFWSLVWIIQVGDEVVQYLPKVWYAHGGGDRQLKRSQTSMAQAVSHVPGSNTKCSPTGMILRESVPPSLPMNLLRDRRESVTSECQLGDWQRGQQENWILPGYQQVRWLTWLTRDACKGNAGRQCMLSWLLSLSFGRLSDIKCLILANLLSNWFNLRSIYSQTSPIYSRFESSPTWHLTLTVTGLSILRALSHHWPKGRDWNLWFLKLYCAIIE